MQIKYQHFIYLKKFRISDKKCNMTRRKKCTKNLYGDFSIYKKNVFCKSILIKFKPSIPHYAQEAGKDTAASEMQ